MAVLLFRVALIPKLFVLVCSFICNYYNNLETCSVQFVKVMARHNWGCNYLYIIVGQRKSRRSVLFVTRGFFAMARADFVVQLHLDLDTYNDLDTASTFRGHWPWKVLSAASGHGKSLSLRYLKTKSWGTYSSVSIQVHLYPQLKREICLF